MTFQYRVRDPLGNIHEGELEAPTVEAATQQLRQDGFHVLQVEEDSSGLGLFARRVSRGEIIYVTCQLAVMAQTGITLSTALGGILDQEQNPSLRRVLTDLKRSVESGEDFSTALSRYPRLFDKTYLSLVRSSEATGLLGEMLERIAAYQRKDLETRGKVRAALAYPAVMLTMAVAVTIFLLTFVLPKFTPLFKRQGVELPKPTLVMMAISDSLMNYWYLWIGGVVLAVAGFLYGRRTEPGRKALDWTKINLPILGSMFRKVTISRSVRTLGTMISSGVPVLESLRLSAEVAGNYHYEKLWRDVQDEVTTGNQIWESLAKNPLFPRVLVQMISAGEQTGRLDDVLAKVSNYYDQEVETSVKAVTSMVEPIMIAVMGVIIGTIALSLLLPIFSLSKMPH
jgi:type IV pilus assembly protein PilC